METEEREEEEGTTETDSVTLDVQSSVLGQRSKFNG